jgi:hypothetical protein
LIDIWSGDFSYYLNIILEIIELFFLLDIVLFNSAEIEFSSQRESVLIEVSYNGIVRWMFPNILKSYCPVDIKFFPFDK